MLAERYLRRRFAEGVAQGKDEANETWKRILDAHPDKTAAEIRRMMDNGELPTGRLGERAGARLSLPALSERERPFPPYAKNPSS